MTFSLAQLDMTSQRSAQFQQQTGIFTGSATVPHRFRRTARPHGLRDKRERYHQLIGRRFAIREKKIHGHRSPEMKIEATLLRGCRGIARRDFYYLIGIRIKVGDSAVSPQPLADSPSDEGSIWREFLSKLIEVENPVLIHYGGFETVFLKRMMPKVWCAAKWLARAKATQSPINLVSYLRADLFSTILMDEGHCRLAGFKWSDQDVSGVQSIRWRDTWDQNKCVVGKRKNSFTYNLEDGAALGTGHPCRCRIGRQDISQVRKRGNFRVVVADTSDSKMSLCLDPEFHRWLRDHQ